MFVRRLGRASRRVALLLHGSPEPAAHLQPLAGALSASHHVLLPDLPGYGQTASLGESLSDAQAELEAAVGPLAPDVLDVIGVGLGGYRALQLALSSALPVRRVVVLGGFATLTDDERRRLLTWADVLRGGGDLCDLVIGRALDGAQRDADPALVERLRGWVHELAPAVWCAELAAWSRAADLLPRLEALRATLLVMHGVSDRLIPVEHGQEVAAAAPHALLERLPCGHLPLDEIPERVLPHIRAFLSP